MQDDVQLHDHDRRHGLDDWLTETSLPGSLSVVGCSRLPQEDRHATS